MEKTAMEEHDSFAEDEYLHAQVNMANLKLDIKSKQVPQTLSELRKILEHLDMQDELESFAAFELRAALSDEFINNQSAMQEIKRLLTLEQQHRVVKEMIPATEEIDFIHGKKLLKLEHQTIKQSVSTMLATIDTLTTKHALIHVKGLVPEHERLVIVDHIHQQIPNAKIRAYQTNQDIEGKILLEGVFFGDYDSGEGET